MCNENDQVAANPDGIWSSGAPLIYSEFNNVRCFDLIDKDWLQVVVFNQQPLLTDVVGAVLILCTIFAITLEKSRNDGAMTAEEEALDASIASQE